MPDAPARRKAWPAEGAQVTVSPLHAPSRQPRPATGGAGRKPVHGISTVSTTWMTPFDCMTLGMVMRALSPLASTTTPAAAVLHEPQVLAFDGLERGRAVVARRHRGDLRAVIRPGTT